MTSKEFHEIAEKITDRAHSLSITSGLEVVKNSKSVVDIIMDAIKKPEVTELEKEEIIETAIKLVFLAGQYNQRPDYLT
jgi:acetolactate synthase small subunit